MKLTAKQRKFANAWIKTHNATQSAIKAGYSKKAASSIGAENLRKPQIQEYINKRTSKIEKQEDDEVDAVLANIYRIATGKNISNHVTTVDHLKGKTTNDKTYTGPAETKQQVAAAELWMRIKGQFKNDNDEIEKAKAKKLNAEAKIAEAKAKRETDDSNGHVSVNITMPGDETNAD